MSAPFWQPPPERYPGRLPHKTDVLVIAGGIREDVDVAALNARRHDVAGIAGEDCCEAGVVILATNAYTPQLVPGVKIQPARAQMIASAPESTSIAELPVYSNYGYRYWRQ